MSKKTLSDEYEEINLIGGEISYLIKHRHIVIECPSCGYKLFVWPNRNQCQCHRARCLKCKSSPSYELRWGQAKSGIWYCKLRVYNDTHVDYLNARETRLTCKLKHQIDNDVDNEDGLTLWF